MAPSHAPEVHVEFHVHPDSYKHWQLSFDGPIARLAMKVNEAHPFREGYALKLNSYDLSVDIELSDAVQRLRFGHPEVKSVVVTSGADDCFCAGANIYMLGTSSHAFKVNFCKYTNETRLYIEQACERSGQHYLAALNGLASGGGYELALACESIVLQDDGASAVSFPETPLLAVLPGTGGLTRLVDKRKVRRDLADVFSTLAEGIRGKRAVAWGLVDAIYPRSQFDAKVKERALATAANTPTKNGPGVSLPKLTYTENSDDSSLVRAYKYVTLSVNHSTRVAEIVVHGPSQACPCDGAALRELGAELWLLRSMRELDDAVLQLRFNHPRVGLVLLKTKGDAATVIQHDEALLALTGSDWFANEVALNIARVMRRLELSARSLFAIIEPGSCFVGTLFELALLADRSYMLESDPDDGPVAKIGLTAINFGPLPMSNGLTRLATRFLANPQQLESLANHTALMDAAEAIEQGLVTFAPDDIDWDDDVRIAIEERASISPDALTGMEANLRFAGPETMETKIFARLSAWQNWIFQRPNAVGERGALTMYGRPERPEFDWRRT